MDKGRDKVRLKFFVADDIKGHKYAVGISNALRFGLLSGYPDGSFKPDKSITRAEVVKVLNTFIGRESSKVSDLDFSDMANHWAADEVLAASQPITTVSNRNQGVTVLGDISTEKDTSFLEVEGINKHETEQVTGTDANKVVGQAMVFDNITIQVESVYTSDFKVEDYPKAQVYIIGVDYLNTSGDYQLTSSLDYWVKDGAISFFSFSQTDIFSSPLSDSVYLAPGALTRRYYAFAIDEGEAGLLTFGHSDLFADDKTYYDLEIDKELKGRKNLSSSSLPKQGVASNELAKTQGLDLVVKDLSYLEATNDLTDEKEKLTAITIEYKNTSLDNDQYYAYGIKDKMGVVHTPSFSTYDGLVKDGGTVLPGGVHQEKIYFEGIIPKHGSNLMVFVNEIVPTIDSDFLEVSLEGAYYKGTLQADFSLPEDMKVVRTGERIQIGTTDLTYSKLYDRKPSLFGPELGHVYRISRFEVTYNDESNKLSPFDFYIVDEKGYSYVVGFVLGLSEKHFNLDDMFLPVGNKITRHAFGEVKEGETLYLVYDKEGDDLEPIYFEFSEPIEVLK